MRTLSIDKFGTTLVVQATIPLPTRRDILKINQILSSPLGRAEEELKQWGDLCSRADSVLSVLKDALTVMSALNEELSKLAKSPPSPVLIELGVLDTQIIKVVYDAPLTALKQIKKIGKEFQFSVEVDL